MNTASNSINRQYKRFMLFDKKSSWNKRVLYYLFYTVTFSFIILCISYWFYTNNKSLIWKVDGLYQHFNSLAYYGDYLRGIIRNFLDTGKLSIPLWDFHIGYGSDIITTLHYYVIGDPLNLLSVFVPKAYTEILYEALIILRLYLAGISFSAYCHKRKKGRYQTLAGTLVYVFCGFAMMAAVKHPFFVNPMIYFPIVLIGIEKIFAKEKPYTFIIAVTLSAISNFYFFYMITILMFFYAVIRFFMLFKEEYIKNFLQQLGKFIWYYLTGLFMACIIFLPVVLQVTSGNRWKTDRMVGLLYDVRYYLGCITGFITPFNAGSWNIMGYSTIALIAVLCLFSIKGRYKELKISFLFLTALMLIPAGGYMLNGFAYVSNRWIWGYSFLIAFILTSMIPELLKLSRKRLLTLVLMSGVYIGVFYSIEHMQKRYTEGIIIVYVAFLVLLIMDYLIRRQKKSGKVNSMVGIRILLMGLICINIIINAREVYSPARRNYIKNLHQTGTSMAILEKSAAKAVQNIDDPGFYRYEENRYGADSNSNTALQTKLNSTIYYFSLANGYISQYLLDLNMDIVNSYSYKGLDGQAIPGTLANVKYFVCKEGDEGYLPYGYTEIAGSYKKKKEEIYHAYENKYVLPLGFTYSNKISEGEYQTLTAIEKQQAMMQAVVLEETEDIDSSRAIQFTDKNLDYEIKPGKGVELKGNTFCVTKKNAQVTLSFAGQKNCENYVNIKELKFESKKRVKEYDLIVSSSDTKKAFKVRTPKSPFFENIHDFLINTGYSEEPYNQITIVFPNTGKYTFDKIEVINQPMDQFENQVKVLKEDVLENVEINTDSVSGMITLDTPKTLCMSIPYSRGWKAYVDGTEEKLMRANTMYMALDLSEGSHTIQLSYVTPGIREGIGLMILGLISLLCIFILERRKKSSKV